VGDRRHRVHAFAGRLTAALDDLSEVSRAAARRLRRGALRPPGGLGRRPPLEATLGRRRTHRLSDLVLIRSRHHTLAHLPGRALTHQPNGRYRILRT
jgi:hypothetical protein